MNFRVFAFLAFLALLACSACAVPAPVTSISGEFVGYNSVKIFWGHGGGATSYRVYRGESVQDAKLIATVQEKYYVDQGLEFNKEYAYYVTAVDPSGESNVLRVLSVRQTDRPSLPFTVKLVSPEKSSLSSGERVDFVVEVASPLLAELKNLDVTLVNDESGVEKKMFPNPGGKLFSLSETIPSSGSAESLSAAYTINVTCVFGGETLFYSETRVFTIAPRLALVQENPGILALSLLFAFGPFFLLLAIALAAIFLGRKYYLRKRAERDALNLELALVLIEQAVLKYDALKKRVSPGRYAEKERELQERQNKLEARLGHKKGIRVSANPLAGFSRNDMEAIGRLVKTIGLQKRMATKDEMLAWLVKRGESDKIAKKAVELIYHEWN